MAKLSNPQSGPEKGPIKVLPFDLGGYLFFAVRPLLSGWGRTHKIDAPCVAIRLGCNTRERIDDATKQKAQTA